MKIYSDRRGFTLIEILAVLTIIGLLATFLLPSVGNMMGKARRTRVVNNLRQIGLAHQSYIAEEGAARTLNQCRTTAEWADQLARHSGINEAALYRINEDYLIAADPRPLPKTIGNRSANSPWSMNENFREFPMSFTIIIGISPNTNPSTTPLIYSRGLDPETGKWRASVGDDGGIYGEEGGFILFLDGHVEFLESLENASLTNYGSNDPTVSLRRALNSGAKAINWKGIVWAN